MPKYNITVGADPEFFVSEKGSKGLVMACNKFGGAKGAPLFLSPDGGFLEDGTAIEFNVTPSASLAETWKKIDNLILVFHNKFPQFRISDKTTAKFPIAELKKEPKAMHIGCSADLWAYGLRTAPQLSKFKDSRFAGGHIHIGIDPWPEGLPKETFTKFMDILYYLPAAKTLVSEGRYPFYGHPGLFRETDYGVEYRTPDNYWCNPLYRLSSPYPEQIVKRIDTGLKEFSRIIEKDGHGARLADEVDNYVQRRCELNTYMNDPRTIRSRETLYQMTSYIEDSAKFFSRLGTSPDPLGGRRKSGLQPYAGGPGVFIDELE